MCGHGPAHRVQHHPLNNTGPLRYTNKNKMGRSRAQIIRAWCHLLGDEGFRRSSLLMSPGPYSCGAQVTLTCMGVIVHAGRQRCAGEDPLDKYRKIVAAKRR